MLNYKSLEDSKVPEKIIVKQEQVLSIISLYD